MIYIGNSKGYVISFLLFLFLGFFNVYSQSSIYVYNDSSYIIEGDWFFKEGNLFQKEKKLADFKKSADALYKEVREHLINIIDVASFQSVNNEMELLEQINGYIKDIRYSEERIDIDSIIYFYRERYSNNKILSSKVHTAIKISCKENKTENEKFRLNRILFELIFPDILVLSSADKNGIWKWTIRIGGMERDRLNIAYVEYYLPAFFSKRMREGQDTHRRDYPLTVCSEGTFRVRADVHFRDGSKQEFYYYLNPEQDVSNVENEIYFEGGYNNQGTKGDWKINLRAKSNEVLEEVDFVEYTMSTYLEESVVIKEDPYSNFEIKGKSDGPVYFKIKAVLKDGRVIFKDYSIR